MYPIIPPPHLTRAQTPLGHPTADPESKFLHKLQYCYVIIALLLGRQLPSIIVITPEEKLSCKQKSLDRVNSLNITGHNIVLSGGDYELELGDGNVENYEIKFANQQVKTANSRI